MRTSKILMCLLCEAVFAQSLLTYATSTPPWPMRNATTTHATLPSTGSGSSYASACSNAIFAYSSLVSAIERDNYTITTVTATHGAPSASLVTYYENATTLCDGHPRVLNSPARSLGTVTVYYPGNPGGPSLSTHSFTNYFVTEARPGCSILPSDCNGLYASYHHNMATPTTSLHRPPCRNESQTSGDGAIFSSILGCGRCTVFGEGVQLLYFPTSASRNMCASTPAVNMTYYGSGAVITAYTGRQSSQVDGETTDQATVVMDGRTFTSGTAYISISSVWAADRCFGRYGDAVTDVVLAMPSESVLSLRYTQDHVKIASVIETISGHPVSYADFNEPVPWSAWNGQITCRLGGYGCEVIYEGQYRPQLAIPPEIRQLSPHFQGCQLWFKGLDDPPRALTEAASVAGPTLPGDYSTSILQATPASTIRAPTAKATARPDQSAFTTRDGKVSHATATTSAHSNITPSTQESPNDHFHGTWTGVISMAADTWTASAISEGRIAIGSHTLTYASEAQTLSPGVKISYGLDGLVLHGSSTVALLDAGFSSSITFGDGSVHGATMWREAGGAIILDNGERTLFPDGAAMTFSDGQVVSAIAGGIVLDVSSVFGDWSTLTNDRGIQAGSAAVNSTGHAEGSAMVSSLTMSLGASASSLPGAVFSGKTSTTTASSSSTLKTLPDALMCAFVGAVVASTMIIL